MVLWQQIFGFGIDDFPFKIPFKTRFKIVVFPLWRRDPVLELQIAAICASCCVYFYCALQLSVCRSQWNGCVKGPPCCDLWSRRSHWSGCIKVPMVMWQLLFSILALVLFCCDTSVCKSFSVLKLLCAKASVCKKFSCVKASVCVKGLVCKSFCV